MTKPLKIPETLDEAVNTLLAVLSPAKRASLPAISKIDLSDCTWHLAAWIRNEFSLWDGRSPLLQQQLSSTGDPDKDLAAGLDWPHPDDIAAAITRAAWERLQKEPSE